MGLEVKDKSIVVPGEVLATGMDYLPAQGTYRAGEEIRAARLGLVNIDGRAIKLIGLSGRYVPKKGDTVVGKIVDIAFSGWRMEMNSAYSAMLGLKDATSDFISRGADLTRFFDIEDYVVAKITNVTSQKLVDVTMKGPGLRKLTHGRIIQVNTNKVPRIIGKQGSMVSMIKDKTGTSIVVGQNGVVWIRGQDPQRELLASETIKMIERESHKSGLTDRISKHLEEAVKDLPPLEEKKPKKEAKEEQEVVVEGGEQ